MKTWITPILCCLLLIAAGCGKKGDPVPQDKKNLFSWESADAALTGNGCLAISALMKGAARNVDGFSIELEPLAASADSTLPKELQTPQDTCEGCPFTPRETHVHVLFAPVCAGVDFWHRRKEKRCPRF